ncbi:MAG TPA: GGDEF domain-containing protein [Vicinamibacteria bacterium]|nr:GGDEF domain-containing protein [Vicinamibacteria bacterium]
MRRHWSLWPTVSVSLVAISAFPIYTVFILAPLFEDLLVKNTKNEAIRLASSFSTLLLEGDEELRRDALPSHLLDRLVSLGDDGHLVKLRIYSPHGEIIYSSDSPEVGRSNVEAYFKEIERTGTARAEIIPRDARSLENEVVPADVVETYVPITKGGRLLGVFELYNDVSRERKDLDRLVYRSYGTLFVITLALLALVLATSFQAHRSMQERARAEEQLRQLSLTDDLTGLYNRRGFLALSEQQTRVAHRDKRPMLMISVDLDGLKRINDTFGHKAGDSAIVETAQVLKESFRDADLVARIGGDEFAILLTGGEAEFDGEMLDRRLRDVVGKHNRRNDRPYGISLSVGFAHCDAAGTDTFEEWLHRADTMMYEQKRRKRAL